MFLENTVNPKEQFGWIEVICGSMFSGKTEELIRRLTSGLNLPNKKLKFLNLPLMYVMTMKWSCLMMQMKFVQRQCLLLQTSRFLQMDCDVVGIDEAQFFDDEIVNVCNDLANKGVRVIVAGLDMDFKGNPFGPMPNLMATAEYVTKVHAVCTHTGNLAQYSHRKSKR